MDNDLVQVRGQAAQAMGTVLHLEGRVLDLDGRPVDGRAGRDLAVRCAGPLRSSAPARPRAARCGLPGLRPHDGEAEGRYSFRTLKPVAYPGRTPHIHFKVATASGGLLTSQFYIAGEPGNERDGVFRAAVRDPAPARTHRDAACRRRRRRGRRARHDDGYRGRLGAVHVPAVDGPSSAGCLILKEHEPWRAEKSGKGRKRRVAWRSGAI